ncbi:NAD(P)-binding protein [Hyaloscypha hepaticicola]|uniref:NAD(P)-binding protein n=1 Tax=Hyaloscypha hepaticicola TaxID=2082293 RepID=A0A2J6PUP6_9HELO|nr:NAD(P)-binding protein [Hyaloscypha hepaticicola]
MHILLLGASGRTGKLILHEALSNSHTVTALVRDPSSLTPTSGLTITTGTPLSYSSIEAAITSTPSQKIPDAIIIALASVRATDSPFSKPTSPPRLLTESHARVLEVMRKFGIGRLITISAFGVGESIRNVFLPVRMVLKYSSMAYAFEDHGEVESLVRRTAGEWKKAGRELEWTLVRPCMLNDGEVAEVRVLGDEGEGAGFMAGISRGSLVRFLVERCLEKGEFVGCTPVICN